MTTASIPPIDLMTQYRERIRRDTVIAHHIGRRFTSAKENGGYAPDIASSYSSLLRAREPVIGDLLALPNVLVLAEPGAGKSTVVKAAVIELLTRQEIVPVQVSLLECREQLGIPTLVRASLGELADIADLSKKYYVFDGLDEVPRELLGRTAMEIRDILNDAETAAVDAHRDLSHSCRQDGEVARPMARNGKRCRPGFRD